MIGTTSILWADGKKVDASVEKSQSSWISVLWREKAIDEQTSIGGNIENVLGASGMLIIFKQFLVCTYRINFANKCNV